MKKKVRQITTEYLSAVIIAVIIPPLLLLSGCGQSSQKPEMQQQSAQGKESTERFLIS